MGPVSPQMRIMRIAVAKAQALPNTIDERLAKIRKAALATQKKSRASSCGLSFSLCVVIIFWFATRKPDASPYTCRARRCGAAHQATRESPAPLATEDQTEHETDSERGKDRLHRVLANVLLAVLLKTAYAMECVIQYFFSALPIFVGHCASG